MAPLGQAGVTEAITLGETAAIDWLVSIVAKAPLSNGHRRAAGGRAAHDAEAMIRTEETPMQPPARPYSRSYCEPQYDPFATAPDADEVNARRLALADKARARLDAHFDLAYGGTQKERLDVYPAIGKSRGVMVYLHGGYWRSMDKRDMAFVAEPFVTAGVTVVLVNYNLAPDVTLDKIVSEVRAACGWVWHNVWRYGGDRDRIHVAGNSAGGHLTAMMAATEWPRIDPTLPADLMKGGAALSGLYDLEPLLFTSVNDSIMLDGESAARNSPVHFRPAPHVRLVLAVGELESAEFKRQTRVLAQAWHELSIQPLIVPARHHFHMPLELANPRSELFVTVLVAMGLQDRPGNSRGS